MKIWKLTLGLCLVAGTAAAQPTDSPPPNPNPNPPPPDTNPPPPNPNPPPPNPSGFHETKSEPVPMAAPVDNEDRPLGFSVGIGFGYTFVMPNSLETPNITSARFRLASGLTFEPVVRFQQSSVDIDVGTSTKTKQTTLEVGALARYPFKQRGRVDFVLLGGAFVRNVADSPPTDNMDKTQTDFSLVYGLACEFWISPHWNLSMTALNTIVSVDKVSQEMGPGTETVTTTSTFGAIYDPVVSAMIHLYY